MTETTTIRVSTTTRDQLRDLAQHRHQTLAATVEQAVRLLRQDQMALDLAAPLTDEEIAWIDADAG